MFNCDIGGTMDTLIDTRLKIFYEHSKMAAFCLEIKAVTNPTIFYQ